MDLLIGIKIYHPHNIFMQEKYNMFGFEPGMEPGPKNQMNNCVPYQLRHLRHQDILIHKERDFSLYLENL